MSTVASNVSGNEGGVQKVDVIAEIAFDVTAWCGAWIKLQGDAADPDTPLGTAERLYYLFSTTPTEVIVDTEALDSASPSAGAPDWIAPGGQAHEIVPRLPAAAEKMYLHVKAGGTGGAWRVKARKSQQG